MLHGYKEMKGELHPRELPAAMVGAQVPAPLHTLMPCDHLSPLYSCSRHATSVLAALHFSRKRVLQVHMAADRVRMGRQLHSS